MAMFEPLAESTVSLASPGDGREAGRLRVVLAPTSAPPAALVRVSGELDLATAPRLHAELETLLREGFRDLDLDLDQVDFCDVAGLNMLLRSHAAAVTSGGRLVVYGSCPPLRLMMRVLQPAGAFELAPPEEDHPRRPREQA
jgi:anti-sigma B factor antagonist